MQASFSVLSIWHFPYAYELQNIGQISTNNDKFIDSGNGGNMHILLLMQDIAITVHKPHHFHGYVCA